MVHSSGETYVDRIAIRYPECQWSTHPVADGAALVEMEARAAKLRRALSRLVGCQDQELEAMEASVRMSPAPADDKAAIIDAIQVLRETRE